MVAGGVIHEDWLNNNRNRRFPFMDDVSLKDDSDSLEIPRELIVDLIFPVPAQTYDVSKFYLKQLTVFAGGVIISIGYDGEAAAIATRAITEAGHTENAAYYIEGTGDFADSVGRIAIGRFDEIKKYGGSYSFSVGNARLLPTVFRPSLQGVSALRIVNADNEESDLIQGDVEILAGDNIGLTLITPPSGAKQLRISAVPSTDYEAECECPDAPGGRCIETINGIGPDPNTGDFLVRTANCINWAGISHGIELEDTCADPCCGCNELQVLRDELARLASQIATQRAYAERALGNVEQMRDVILASKLGNIVPCD
jgi:hypothetical protein